MTKVDAWTCNFCEALINERALSIRDHRNVRDEMDVCPACLELVDLALDSVREAKQKNQRLTFHFDEPLIDIERYMTPYPAQ